MNITVQVEEIKSPEVQVSELAVGDYFVSSGRLFMKVEETQHPGNPQFIRGPRNAVCMELPSNSGGQTYHFPDGPHYRVRRVKTVDVKATY